MIYHVFRKGLTQLYLALICQEPLSHHNFAVLILFVLV